VNPAREAAKYFDEGIRLLDAGDRAGAVTAFDKARAVAAERAPSYLRIAAAKLDARQEWGQGLLFYAAALKVDPLNAETRQQMQEAMYRASGLADGGGVLQEIVRTAPDWAVGLAARGRWERYNGQPDAGRKDLEKSQSLPQDADAPFVRAAWAELLIDSGRKDEGRTILREVLRDPRTPRWLSAEINRSLGA
jgi:tetratricopeptide (TPR) repeat protein